MKRFYNIKSNSGRSFAATIITLVTLLLCGTHVWADGISIGHDLWLYNNDGSSTTFKTHVWGSWGSYDASFNLLGDNVYCSSVGAEGNASGYCILNASSTNLSGDQTATRNAGNCCFHTSDSGWGIAPMYNLQITLKSTNYGGSGTDANPYSVYHGTIDVTNTSTVANATEVAAYYCWKSTGDWIGPTLNDKDDSFSISAGQKVTVQSKGKCEYGGKYSVERQTPDLVVKADAYKRTAKAYYKTSAEATPVSGTTGGTVKVSGGVAGASAEQIKKYNSATTFVATHSGDYRFVGWYNNAAGSGEPLSTNASYDVTNASATSSDITVYAIFQISDNPITVLIADTAKIYDGPRVELMGYLKYSGCDQSLRERGFFYCKGEDCNPTEVSLKTAIEGSTSLAQGSTFTKIFSESSTSVALEANTDYCYRAYVKSNNTGRYYLSSEKGKFHTRNACNYVIGDTVYYTIDNSQEKDRCELRFRSLSEAINDMKTTDAHDRWLGTDKFLSKPVVFEVVAGTYGNSNNSDRETCLEEINTSNGFSPTKDPTYRLIIRAKNPKLKPTFQGGISLLQSRYITLQNLNITRHSTISEHDGSALELGYYTTNGEANNQTVGSITNSDIKIIGCNISASGFNCIHALCSNGLMFEDCDFTMAIEASADPNNDRKWGASVKLMNCKNVKFVRNSLKGSHATTMFLQHVQNMIIMNNVFWNDNGYTSNVAFMRPVIFMNEDAKATAAHKVTNIGIYYNTFYLANRASSLNTEKIDFLRFGGEAQTNSENKEFYDVANIDFMYNNCYSYDERINSRNSNEVAFFGYTDGQLSHFTHNNFWAQPDTEASSSNFKFGSDPQHVNVKHEVCKTTASDPDGLIIKGDGLNTGVRPLSDISGFNYANTTLSDRFRVYCRPDGSTSEKWTFGAYQQADPVTADIIVWNGTASSDWDDRNNWVTPEGERLNCAFSFTDGLKVIVPDANSTVYPVPVGGIKNLPKLPQFTDATRANVETGPYYDELVEAGRRAVDSPTTSKFASQIELEYGGAILGVENLFDGTLRYTSATNKFEAGRGEWILVGTVVKPFNNGESGETRNIQSGDYYIENHEPHVYMQRYVQDGSDIKPGIPFTSLQEEVSANTAFGIYIPDQYGPNKLAAQWYYTYFKKDADKVGDGTEPKTFTFKGRFANDIGLPSYTITSDGKFNFVNNSYPANLNLSGLVGRLSGLNAKTYDYELKAWGDATAISESVVKPQNGFVLYSNTLTNVSTAATDYVAGSTKYKRASVDTYLVLKVVNASDDTGSKINVIYGSNNLPKAFSYNTSNPELYIPGTGDEMYSTIGIADEGKCIPVSVRNKQDGKMTIQFVLDKVSGFESVILEDRLLNKNYDLTQGEAPYFNNIVPGDCVGRFYLNINYGEEEIPTSVDEKTAEADSNNGRIDIYGVHGDKVVISSTESIALEKAVITDMSGRSSEVKLSDCHYNIINLDDMQGVYIITAVGDSVNKTEKVIVK